VFELAFLFVFVYAVALFDALFPQAAPNKPTAIATTKTDIEFVLMFPPLKVTVQ